MDWKRESRGGKTFTFVDFYMKEKGLSDQEVSSAFVELIEDTWKDMNAEWVNCASIPIEMALQFLNILQFSEVVYKNFEDGFTDPDQTQFAELMAALLLDPMPVWVPPRLEENKEVISLFVALLVLSLWVINNALYLGF